MSAADPDSVNVWSIPCSDPPVAPGALAATLSDEERRRVERFRFEADRVRALVGRGMLRSILAETLGTDPAALEIESEPHGKPVLRNPHAGPLHFNVSHSGDWVLIGVARGAEVGVDVEMERPLTDLDALIERFFAPGEVRTIRALPAEQRGTAFFLCWTRKEAYLKATGTGMQTPLDSFEVEARPGHPPALLGLGGSVEAAARWRLWSGSPAPGYAAAVATVAQGPIRAWLWSNTAGLQPWRG